MRNITSQPLVAARDLVCYSTGQGLWRSEGQDDVFVCFDSPPAVTIDVKSVTSQPCSA